jgi:hypothetical protein
MARRGSRIPRPLQPLVGGAVLVGAVRAIDLVWRRTTGRRPPLRSSVGTDDSGTTGAPTPPADAADDAAPGVVRDRLLYALLIGAALRLARRAGLKDDGDA